MAHVVESADNKTGPVHKYNLGTETTTFVDEIAEVVSDVLDVEPRIEYTGGDRGWTRDVPKMRFSVERLLASGWELQYESNSAVQLAAEELAQELG